MNDLEREKDRNNFELSHYIVPGEEGRDHIEEMAEAFIIEFKRMRWTDVMILEMFRNPAYTGPYFVYQERGEQFVVHLLSCVTRGVYMLSPQRGNSSTGDNHA